MDFFAQLSLIEGSRSSVNRQHHLVDIIFWVMAPATVVRLAMPVFDGLLIHPESEGTTFYQGLVVLFPVADLLFGLAHLTL